MGVKRIGVLTSGGDAPGMNAAIRAVVRTALHNGIEVYGIEQGYNGLIKGNCFPLDSRSVGDIINRGGTFLYTARCPEFRNKEGRAKAVEEIKKHQIDGLVTIGGDGTFTGARLLVEEFGIPAVGIPATIDNDLAYTDFTLGFDTAINTVLDAMNKIRDTMTSHDRVSVVEVMGNKSGELAIYTGLVGGAECVIVPEIKYDLADIAAQLKSARERGKYGCIVVLAEGAGNGSEISEQIEKLSGLETRATVLGHIQRGGNPSARDIQLGSQFGAHAVELLKNGISKRVVGIRENKIFDMDISEAMDIKSQINKTLYDLTYILSR